MEDAKKILKKLNQYGEAYIVGGAVRDYILGRECDDIDIATNVPIDKIEELFETHDIGKNKDFGVSVIKYNNKIYEIANFRKDGVYTDGRRPDSVEITSSFEEDVLRRDFTINGLGLNIFDYVVDYVVDYVDGQKDIRNKIIKCIGNPRERFQEDYLRMLRAIRFSSTLNFNIDPDTLTAIIDYSHKIDFISKERIQKELWKMASQYGKKFAKAIELLKATGLLEYILPEIDCMDQYEHNPKYHPEGNVFEHTIAALKEYDGNNPLVNLSILFHDIGKPVTRTYESDEVRYHGHAYDGVKVAENICNRLKFSNDIKDTILYCVENHMKFHKFFEMKDSKITKLITNKNWETLYIVGYADDACRGFNVDEFWNKIAIRVIKLFDKFIDNKEFEKIKKTVNGNLIMSITDLEQGPEIGTIQKSTIDWIIDNNIDLTNISLISNYIQEIHYDSRPEAV